LTVENDLGSDTVTFPIQVTGENKIPDQTWDNCLTIYCIWEGRRVPIFTRATRAGSPWLACF
jgi:hypothetical protein